MRNEYAIPQPKFQIGQRVKRSIRTKFHRKLWLRAQIEYWRGVARKAGATGRLHEYYKTSIRRAMNVIDTAHTIEIAGVAPLYGHVNEHHTYNECYVPGVPCAASGMEHGYTLLFRADVPNTETYPNEPGPRVNTVVILAPRMVLVNEKDVLKKVILPLRASI
jgi:hypothetical protein